MTTPRDAIGLSDRLLAEIGQPVIYRNDAVLREAAKALDALQARVKELEAKAAALFWSIPDDIAAQIKCGDLQKRAAELFAAESRATSAEQERDEAYERACGVIRQWTNHAHMQLCAGEMTAQERRTTEAILNAVERQVRRLAVGTEKEGK